MKKTEGVNEGGEVTAYHHDGDNNDDAEEAGLCWLPAELWAMVCGYLGTADLARLSTTCWALRSHAFARVRHHTFTPLGLVTSRNIMRRALAFVATWPSLESLSLSAWDSFPDALVGHLPEALESLDLGYTSITNRGLARLPVGLTLLDLSGTQVASTSLRALGRLSSLRDLTLTDISGLSAQHLQGLPASVEVLDLTNCSGPFAKQELLGDQSGNPATPALTLPRMPWPPALRELKLGGVRLSLGLLYGMPTTLESLDISRCTLWPVPVDMDACLPRLQTLRADYAGLDSCAYHLYRHTALWSLPSGLKLLSLAGMRLNSPTDRQLAFLPASITSLDISRTALIQDQYSHVSDSSDGWFHTLPKRLPHLRLLNLTMPWPRGDPQCLEIMEENKVTVIFCDLYPFSSEDEDDLFRPGVGQISVPREQDPKWVDFVKLCAEEQRRITWRDLPDEADHNEDDADDADHDNDDDEEEEEQGSLLFMGL